ncbi:hypothetical protein N7931_09865 [Catenovulum sp. 2E275]|uniref:hypothetical protein n=1 Tax=Catenovulum sp. 2E275 TaxID=2980497 RepID=UPI0021D35642|nr:hypothetical protein [Catenovulum sp. 2E275]MCU4675940.1 hypothetical protein [Catenovulum sp. 2E275]
MNNKACITLILATLFSTVVLAEEMAIEVTASAPYYDENIIQANVIAECTELGNQFSESTSKYLKENGFNVELKSADEFANNGESLKLQITNAVSSGNAFIGHRKMVSITAELYQNGQLVDTFKHSRNSGGGFLGGFKGSCSVLHRCVNTLGNDVAKWLAKKKKA